MSRFRAFLFDLDGTLVDTELYHFRAYQQVLNSLGHKLDRDFFIQNWLVKAQGMGYFLKKYQPDADIQVMRDKKRDVFLELVNRELKPFPGVLEILKWAQQNDVRCAVASGSRLKEVKLILEITGLEPYFETVLGFDSVEKHKPEPDVFLSAAQELQTDPNDCLVFENTPMGVNAAHAAAMKCVLIPSSFSQDLEFPPVNLRLNSFTEFNPDKFSKIP